MDYNIIKKCPIDNNLYVRKNYREIIHKLLRLFIISLVNFFWKSICGMNRPDCPNVGKRVDYGH